MNNEILQKIQQWLSDAEGQEPNDPNAISLATVDGTGQPDVRIVLLKDFDARGFTFYTNLTSKKSDDVRANPKAAICLHWKSTRKQIRAQGHVEQVTDAEADAYFASRSRDSRIGAWASDQSSHLDKRDTFLQKIEHFTQEFEGKDVPRPSFWGGWRLIPTKVEFWQDMPHRLHDRDVYVLQNGVWQVSKLYP